MNNNTRKRKLSSKQHGRMAAMARWHKSNVKVQDTNGEDIQAAIAVSVPGIAPIEDPAQIANPEIVGQNSVAAAVPVPGSAPIDEPHQIANPEIVEQNLVAVGVPVPGNAPIEEPDQIANPKIVDQNLVAAVVPEPNIAIDPQDQLDLDAVPDADQKDSAVLGLPAPPAEDDDEIIFVKKVRQDAKNGYSDYPHTRVCNFRVNILQTKNTANKYISVRHMFLTEGRFFFRGDTPKITTRDDFETITLVSELREYARYHHKSPATFLDPFYAQIEAGLLPPDQYVWKYAQVKAAHFNVVLPVLNAEEQKELYNLNLLPTQRSKSRWATFYRIMKWRIPRRGAYPMVHDGKHKKFKNFVDDVVEID